MKKIIIEKNVPIPDESVKSGVTIKDFPLNEMEIGDSFTVPAKFTKKLQNNLCSKINQYLKRNSLKLRFTVREDVKTKNIRIWRIADATEKPKAEIEKPTEENQSIPSAPPSRKRSSSAAKK